MTRTENDLRAALRELARRADQHGGPSATDIVDAATEDGPRRRRNSAARRPAARWLAPLAAAAVVVAAAVTAGVVESSHGSAHRDGNPAAGQPTAVHIPAQSSPAHTSPAPAKPDATTQAAAILDQAAAELDAAPHWTPPAPHDFYYVRTTQATTWSSVSGTRAGKGHTADGSPIWVPGCVHGQIVSTGESGPCTLNDVPHYRADAPTDPAAWDAYLEQIAPGAKAADAQGKIIVQVLHGDLVAPKATAALLRYTATCPGLHTLDVAPVTGEKLIGVTCTSMTNGSYGLAFDATSDAFAGFVVVTPSGQSDGPAEIIRQTGIVPAIGRTP